MRRQEKKRRKSLFRRRTSLLAAVTGEAEEEEEEEEEFIAIGNWRGKHNSLSRGWAVTGRTRNTSLRALPDPLENGTAHWDS